MKKYAKQYQHNTVNFGTGKLQNKPTISILTGWTPLRQDSCAGHARLPGGPVPEL